MPPQPTPPLAVSLTALAEGVSADDLGLQPSDLDLIKAGQPSPRHQPRPSRRLSRLLKSITALIDFLASHYPHEWPEFFSVPVLFLMCITVINDGTLISIGYDYATPSKFPERWVLPALFVVGSSIMFVATSSSLLLLYFCLDSNEPGSLFQRLGLGGLTYGHIVTIIFLKVAISDIPRSSPAAPRTSSSSSASRTPCCSAPSLSPAPPPPPSPSSCPAGTATPRARAPCWTA
jgi:hypothetical protein